MDLETRQQKNYAVDGLSSELFTLLQEIIIHTGQRYIGSLATLFPRKPASLFIASMELAVKTEGE